MVVLQLVYSERTMYWFIRVKRYNHLVSPVLYPISSHIEVLSITAITLHNHMKITDTQLSPSSSATPPPSNPFAEVCFICSICNLF